MTQTIEVDILNEQGYATDEGRLRQAIRLTVARFLPDVPAAVSLMLSTDEEVHRLNMQFRQVDAPTDILSFPSGEPLQPEDDEIAYLGDLIIAWPYASAQAAREGHDLHDSLSLLVVHGTLHLLGYDHDQPASKRDMWAAQESVLLLLGISPEIVPALENADHD